MSKKYSIIIITVVFIMCFSLVLFVYSNRQNIMSKVESEQVAIYQENNLILNQLQEEYDRVMKIVEEEKNVPKSTIAFVPIFMYHFVRDEVGDYPYGENMVKVDTLRQQLEYIKENDYDAIYISEFKKLHKYDKPLALTFDDGWEDFYINAFPLIKEYKIKATLFVVDKFFTTPGYCNLKQLQELKQSGLVDIQSHTMTHPYLTSLNLKDMQHEIANSKIMLKEKLDIDSTIFCYPYGDYNKKVIDITKEHYSYGLDMDGGVYRTDKHNVYEIPRIYANRSMTMNKFISYCQQSKVDVIWD